MAKSTKSSGSSKSIFDIVKGFDGAAEVLSESKTAVISDYIDTGSYILNAAMTGSLFRGIPSGRCTVFAGEPGSGKSYLALSVCRNVQKKGYTPIYLDSEAAIDLEFVKRLGCDPTNFIIKQVTTISEVSTFMSRTCKQMLEMEESERPKVIFVLDSLGNLTSDKEYNDTVDGNSKRDMTKQQEVKALFRTNATALGKLNIPFIVCSHVYNCVCGDTNIIMSDNSIKNIKDVVVGEQVLTPEGNMSVINTAKYSDVKSTYEIEFSDGYKIRCTYGHKFLCKDGNKTKWVTAEDITENDEIICI